MAWIDPNAQAEFKNNPLRNWINKLRGSEEPMHPWVEGVIDLFGEQDTLNPLPVPAIPINHIDDVLGKLSGMSLPAGDASNTAKNRFIRDINNIQNMMHDRGVQDIGRPSSIDRDRLLDVIGEDVPNRLNRQLMQQSHDTLSNLPGYVKDMTPKWTSSHYMTDLNPGLASGDGPGLTMGMYSSNPRIGKLQVDHPLIRKLLPLAEKDPMNDPLLQSALTPLHETGHAIQHNIPWELTRPYWKKFWGMSDNMLDAVPDFYKFAKHTGPGGVLNNLIEPSGMTTPYGRTSPLEDFAEQYMMHEFTLDPRGYAGRTYDGPRNFAEDEFYNIAESDNWERMNVMSDILERMRRGR